MPALDGIRGVAILLVLAGHFSMIMDANTPSQRLFSKLTQAGWTGVDLFFVLSGFLITGILLDSKDSPRYFSSFYMRRILRIFPLYYLAILVFLIGLPLVQKHLGLLPNVRSLGPIQIWFWLYAVNWGIVLAGPTLFQMLGHFWSLAIEEQFYFLWPLAVRVTSKRTLAGLCIALVLVSQGLRIVLFLNGFPMGTIFYLTVTRLDGLAMGSLAALCFRDEDWLSRAASALKYAIPLSLLGLVVVGSVSGGFPPLAGPLAMTISYLFLAVVFTGILISAILQSGTRLERLLCAAWLRSCGKYSYGMYVWHMSLFFFMQHRTQYFDISKTINAVPGLWRLLAVLAYAVVSSVLTYIIARISWWAFEVHFINLKRYFPEGTR
jgi:peptidoglycan/LPS O-acetylase OafA/YrhL